MNNPVILLLQCLGFIESKGSRPYIIINEVNKYVTTTPAVDLTPFLTKEKQLILNMSSEAIGPSGISQIGDTMVSFQMRFNGRPTTMTLDIQGVDNVHTPDSEEVNQLLWEMMRESNYQETQEMTQDKFNTFIQACVKGLKPNEGGDISLQVDISPSDPDKPTDIAVSGKIYPFIYDTIVFMADDGKLHELTFDAENGVFNPGSFHIDTAIVKDEQAKRVMGFIDHSTCAAFTEDLQLILNKAFNPPSPSEKQEVVEQKPADVIQFPGDKKAPAPEEPEDEDQILDLSNVVDINLFRNLRNR